MPAAVDPFAPPSARPWCMPKTATPIPLQNLYPYMLDLLNIRWLYGESWLHEAIFIAVGKRWHRMNCRLCLLLTFTPSSFHIEKQALLFISVEVCQVVPFEIFCGSDGFIGRSMATYMMWWHRLGVAAAGRSVVPKLIRAFTQIKVVIMSYYPQYFTVIAHNAEKIVVLVPRYPPKNRILPPGGNLPTVWESLR